MRHPVPLLTLTLVLACASAETATVNPPPAPPPPPPGTTTSGPETVVLDQASVPTSGGTLTVAKPGNKLDGLTITVPSGGYSAATQWTVTALDSVRPALPVNMVQIGPAIRIKNGQRYAKFAMNLSIPVTVGPDTAISAFFYEPGSGTFELVPTLGREGNKLLLLTQHFSADRLLIPTAGAGLRTAALRGPPAFGEIVIVVVATPDLNVYERRTSTFSAAIDTWEFPNPLSLLSDGICEGMSMSELYYHYMLKTRGTLFQRYDKLPILPGDNPRGIRLASVIQAVFSPIAAWESNNNLGLHATAHGVSWAYAQAASLSMSIQVTGLPQLLNISKSGTWGEGHAVVAYAVDHGNFTIADPNVPGTSRTLQYSGGLFQPFPLSLTPDKPEVLFDEFFVTGVTALLPMQDFAAYFLQFDSYTIGNYTGDTARLERTEFPPTITEYRDELDSTWRPVGTPLTTTSATITLRTRCPLCRSHRAPPADMNRTHSRVFTAAGASLGDDNPNEVEGVQIDVAEGASTFGLQQEAALHFIVDGQPTVGWAFQDFLWLPVLRIPFSVSVDHSDATVGDVLNFNVFAAGTETPTSRYVWTFGDPTAPVTITGNTHVTHAYATTGTFTARVEWRDAANILLGRASVVVTITPPLQVWKFTGVSVAFSTVNNPQFFTDSRWKTDSARLVRIAAGASQAGIRLVDQSFTPTGFPSRTAPAGLYLLEGVSITLATLTDAATENNFSTTGFLGAPGALPAAPQVNGWVLVQQLPVPVNPLCFTHPDSYQRTGTVTNGQVTGLWVPICMQNALEPGINGQPLASMDANVVFSGAIASGTISVIYYFYPNGGVTAQIQKRIGQLTFTATRVTQ